MVAWGVYFSVCSCLASIRVADRPASSLLRCNGTRESNHRPTDTQRRRSFPCENSALYEDTCLYLVPGSHKVPRADEQRAHSTTLEPPQDPLAMPGAIRLVLQRKSLFSLFPSFLLLTPFNDDAPFLQLAKRCFTTPTCCTARRMTPSSSARRCTRVWATPVAGRRVRGTCCSMDWDGCVRRGSGRRLMSMGGGCSTR